MRLLRQRIKTIPLFKSIQVPSDYVGTVQSWQEIDPIKADVQPAQNKRMVELYGERAANMINLYIEKGADIHVGYGAFSLSDGKPTHIVISVLPYYQHLIAVVEKQVVT